MSETLGVSLLQMTSSHDHQQNLQTVLKAIDECSGRILFLPENSLFINTSKDPIKPEQALHPDRDEIKQLQAACQKKGIYLHMGGVAWLEKGEVKNAAVIINPAGELNSPYLKSHLFDLDLGDVKTLESASFKAGSELSTFTIEGFKFATLICYDLRFAELFVHYVTQENVDCFLVPSAFTAKTGEAHWQTLLRARAIETQCYVIAPAQVGGHWNHDKSYERKSWGQSLAFDPWGETLVERPNYNNYLDSGNTNEKPITLVLEKARIKKVRKAMPMAEHRAFKVSLEPRWLESFY